MNVPVYKNDPVTGEPEFKGYESDGTLLAKIFSCPWCSSVYISAVVSAVIGYWSLTAPWLVVLWLATCGGVWFALDLTTEEEEEE